MNSAYISEIYPSVQGEGPYAGERQIFVRLAGCPLRCRYCDTPRSLTASGHRKWTVDEAMSTVRRLRQKSKAHVVSVTGGEPLVQAPFVAELFRRLKHAGFRTYLETAGVHPDALRDVLRFTDVIAMDIKLPSSTGRSFWSNHQRFLKEGGKKIFVKIVLEKKTRLSEVRRALRLASKRPAPPLVILQPATAIEGQVEGPTPDLVADAYAAAKALKLRALVMTQQHKIWGAP